MTATVWSFAGVAHADWLDDKLDGVTVPGNDVIIVENVKEAGSEMVDPTLRHVNRDWKDQITTDVHTDDSQCEENAIKLQVGQIAAMKDVLVANDKALEVKANAAQAAADDAKATANEAKSEAEAAQSTADEAKKEIKDEADAREAADKVLDTKIDTETKRAIGEEQRIEQKFDKEVSRLDSKIDKLDGRIEKVGAMSAAIANLHTMGYDPAAPTEIAVGVGQYRDKTGLAVGAFHYPNRDFMMSFSVSTAGDEFMAGIGATWKIGRKSPEQMLKAQQEKAARERLAEAEAMKKAAKDARVAAQQARHAKMLAERSK